MSSKIKVKSHKNGMSACSSSITNENSEGDAEYSVIPKNLRVIGMTPGGNGSDSKIVVATHSNGHDHFHCLAPFGLVVGDMKELAGILVSTGHIPANGQEIKRIATAIIQEAQNEDVIVLSTQGRHEIEINGKTFKCYVWKKEVYWLGRKPRRKIVVANAADPKSASCDLPTWKAKVGSKLTGNPYLIVVCAHAVAAALRREFDQPRVSISLTGPSGTGKSTTQQSAQSLIGHPDAVRSMSGTKVGLLAYLHDHPDSPVFFQDIRQNDSPEIFFDLVFDVADGAGRMKSGQKQGEELAATMILSNERFAMDMVTSKKGSLDEGLHSRLFEIEFNAEYGAFHHLHGYKYPDEFAKELGRNSRKYYGAAWPSWISGLSKYWPKVLRFYETDLPKVTTEIAALAGESAHDRVNNRILDALSFSAWAAIVASKLGILSLTRQEIVDAFGLVLQEHISRQISGSTPVATQIISEVRGCLDENTHRFADLESFGDERPQSAVYGYRYKSKRHGELFLFLPTVFDRLFVKKFGSVAHKILLEAGFLITTTGRGNQFQVRVQGTEERKSFIAIPAVLRFD